MDASMQTPFNAAQVEILKLFSQGLSEEQTEELRKLLVEFRFKLLNDRVEKTTKAKGMSNEDIDAASLEHRRTTYKNKPENLK